MMNTAMYASDRCRVCGALLSKHTMWELRACTTKLDEQPERDRLENRLRGDNKPEKASEPR
jgi:hypothetical protein